MTQTNYDEQPYSMNGTHGLSSPHTITTTVVKQSTPFGIALNRDGTTGNNAVVHGVVVFEDVSEATLPFSPIRAYNTDFAVPTLRAGVIVVDLDGTAKAVQGVPLNIVVDASKPNSLGRFTAAAVDTNKVIQTKNVYPVDAGNGLIRARIILQEA